MVICAIHGSVVQLILNPGNNLLHVALNEVFYVPFSGKEINSTGHYATSLAGHLCCYHFFHYQPFLPPLEHPLLRDPCCPESDQKSFEDKTILHPTSAQQECLTTTMKNSTEELQSYRGAASS